MDSRLRWLGFLFAMHIGDHRDMDKSEIVMSDAELELSHSLDKGCRFDISHSATKLPDLQQPYGEAY